MAPGTRHSDRTVHHGRIGGGGTDKHLRYLAIEATTWLAQIPRYRGAYERTKRKRGGKVARVVVARMFLRSVYKMLRDDVRFNQMPPGPRVEPLPKNPRTRRTQAATTT